MKITPLFSLPYSSGGAFHDARLFDEGNRLIVSMVSDDQGRARQQGVLFDKPRAFRYRSEFYCVDWQLETSDTVHEIAESDWVADLLRDAVPDIRDEWVMRHFVIFLDDFGCLEVVAESAQLDDDQKMRNYD